MIRFVNYLIPKLANVGCQTIDGCVTLPGGGIRSWISLIDEVRVISVNDTLASLCG